MSLPCMSLPSSDFNSTGAEASNVLVGQVDFLKKPAMAFVRLAEGQLLENLTEVPLPVRLVGSDLFITHV